MKMHLIDTLNSSFFNNAILWDLIGAFCIKQTSLCLKFRWKSFEKWPSKVKLRGGFCHLFSRRCSTVHFPCNSFLHFYREVTPKTRGGIKKLRPQWKIHAKFYVKCVHSALLLIFKWL